MDVRGGKSLARKVWLNVHCREPPRRVVASSAAALMHVPAVSGLLLRKSDAAAAVAALMLIIHDEADEDDENEDEEDDAVESTEATTTKSRVTIRLRCIIIDRALRSGGSLGPEDKTVRGLTQLLCAGDTPRAWDNFTPSLAPLG
jgi:hypothetical protein